MFGQYIGASRLPRSYDPQPIEGSSGRSRISQMGGTNLLLGIIFVENCTKMKKIGLGGARDTPLQSTTGLASLPCPRLYYTCKISTSLGQPFLRSTSGITISRTSNSIILRFIDLIEISQFMVYSGFLDDKN